jgi:hypothetical protein
LYYYRARYYDAKAGRFISKDPIGFGGEDANLFRYVENNPVNFIDPFGLTKKDPWYGRNDRDFQRWFHLCWKQKGGPRVASKADIEEAYAEWLSRGAPRGGKCWGKPDEPKECHDNRSIGEKIWDVWNNFNDWMQRHTPQPDKFPKPFPFPIPLPIPGSL